MVNDRDGRSDIDNDHVVVLQRNKWFCALLKSKIVAPILPDLISLSFILLAVVTRRARTEESSWNMNFEKLLSKVVYRMKQKFTKQV